MEAMQQLQDCEYLRLLIPDINGIARSKVLMPVSFKNFLKSGLPVFHGAIGFAPNGTPCIRQLEDQNCGNGVLQADWSTLHTSDTAADSGAKYKEVLCSMMHAETGQPLGADTRQVAVRMVQELKQLGLRALSTFEIEFRLFHPDGRPAWDRVQFASAAYFSQVEPVLTELHRCCSAAGVEIEVMHTEWGSGQMEVNLVPQYGVVGADHGFLFKLIAKEVAHRHGLVASFATKQLAGETGNGWHLNLSLWSYDGANVFHSDGQQPSPVGQRFLAGMVRHANALAALCSPTVSCYRRLHTPWAPHVADVKVDGRFSTFRLQCRHVDSARVENRLASSACNPYLALAATIAAGIDGIRRELELSDESQLKELPHSLAEALDDLRADSELRDLLGAEVLLWFDVAKTDVELAALGDVNVKEEKPEDFEREREMYRDL